MVNDWNSKLENVHFKSVLKNIEILEVRTTLIPVYVKINF